MVSLLRRSARTFCPTERKETVRQLLNVSHFVRFLQEATATGSVSFHFRGFASVDGGAHAAIGSFPELPASLLPHVSTRSTSFYLLVPLT